jgi:replicative DNA helicase
MLDYVEIIEGSINPTGIWKNAYNYAETVGKFEKVPYLTLEGEEKYHTIYKTNDENLVTIVLLDHIGKLKGELNDGVFLQPQSKALMDKMSDYCGSELRDRLGFSPVVVSQFNRGLEDTQRRVKTEMSPLPSDFKNTGNLYEDADVALALYNPYKLGDNENLGYNIPAFVNSKGYNRFRSCYVLKNSYGVDDIAFGYNFIGEVGIMHELKKADQLTPEDYLRFTEIKAITI